MYDHKAITDHFELWLGISSFIFNKDSKISPLSQDANESNSKLKQKDSQSIEMNRKRDITRSKAQDLRQKQETAKIVNRKALTLNRVNDQLDKADQENVLKSVLGIKEEETVEALAEADPDSDNERIVFSVDREGFTVLFRKSVVICKNAMMGGVKNPALEGRLQVSFVIEPAETVNDELGQAQEPVEAILSDVHLKVDEVKHPMMSACLLNLVEGLHFENVSSQVTVNYPFSFKAKP